MGETLDKPQATADALGANNDTFDLPPTREKETKTAFAPLKPYPGAPTVRDVPPVPRQDAKNPWDADPIFAGAYKIISPGEGAHGDPNAKNPYSSATGLVQITRPTFLSTFKKHHPEESQGKSDDEIWALARDGNTNTRVGAELAHDNAIQMQRAGVAVSPTTIAAAHRIGAGGTIGALKADPNTPLSQVAPDVLSRGNEDIAGMTVGQFLQNPYPGRRGGGSGGGAPPGGDATPGDPAALFRIQQAAQEGNRMFADLNRNLQEDRERISRLAKDYKPFDPTPPPKQPDPDPLQAFGSVASLFGLLASGLSKTPAIAAMNALTGSIEGAAQHDWKKYQTEYRAWKDNTDYAIQAHKIYSEDVNEALRMMSTDATTGNAMLQLALSKSGDYENQMRAWRKDPLEFERLQADAEKSRLQMEKMRDETADHLELRAANNNLEKNTEALRFAESTGDSAKIAEAKRDYEQAQEIVDRKYSQIERKKRAELGGFNTRTGSNLTAQQEIQMLDEWKKNNPGADTGEVAAAWNRIRGKADPNETLELKKRDLTRKEAGGTPQSIATRKFMEEHPDATAQELRDFVVGLKDDAPNVAARKDREATRKENKDALYERSIEINQDFKERRLALDRDKSIAANERGIRALELKELHERAIEDNMKARLARPPSAAVSKERDAAILAESAFVEKEGRSPTDSDEDQKKMAQLRTESRRNATSEVITDGAADFTAKRVLEGDERATVGMARTSANITKVTNHIVMAAKEQNISPRELTVRIAEFMGTVAGERTLGVMAARMEVMANQVGEFAPLVVQRSHAVDRTQYPDLNSIQLAIEKKTGDENVVLFAQALNSMSAEYAKFLNPQGIATDADKAKAREILDIAWTKGQLDGVIKQIQMEIGFGQKSIGKTRQQFRDGFGASSDRAAAPPSAAPAAATGGQTSPVPGQFVEGMTYYDAKGQKAIYRNGKFEDVP